MVRYCSCCCTMVMIRATMKTRSSKTIATIVFASCTTFSFCFSRRGMDVRPDGFLYKINAPQRVYSILQFFHDFVRVQARANRVHGYQMSVVIKRNFH
mmetsp:Transcript_3789/g.8178  ORF Transcript_3789/g.8178 Transcript_3789/m.8178 type:complete len:98 (-) Transcript_3789:12-305(-)